MIEILKGETVLGPDAKARMSKATSLQEHQLTDDAKGRLAHFHKAQADAAALRQSNETDRCTTSCKCA